MSPGRDFSAHPGSGGFSTGEWVLVVGALALLALSGFGAVRARSAFAEARDKLEQVRLESQGARDRLRALESRPGSEGGVASRALLTVEAPPTRVVADLAALLPPDVRLESLGLAYGRGVELELQVAARRAQAYDVFLKRLVASPLISAVLPGTENRDGEARASVRATYIPVRNGDRR
jgi:hypothetical protein